MTLPYTNFVNLREATLDERSIKKICIFMSFLGLAIIYLMELTAITPCTEINKITKDNIGEQLKVCGTVNKKYVTDNGHIFFDLKDNSSIKIALFKNNNNPTPPQSIENNKQLCLEGTVKLYKGDLEIICDRLLTDSRE